MAVGTHIRASIRRARGDRGDGRKKAEARMTDHTGALGKSDAKRDQFDDRSGDARLSFGALDHVGFAVSDLDRSSDWYTRLLGEEPFVRHVVESGYIGEITGYAGCRQEWALWRLPHNTMLELIQYAVPETVQVDMETYNVGNSHLCLVTEDVDGVCERMRGDAEFRSSAPVEISSGPYKGARVCDIRDPDGLTIELMELPPGGLSVT
jgi:catechol 2,3-dioxygenase-like lactoylglutathione lyase family enzyme